ncbi:MAG: hypothetical protein AB2A00_28075 [Myxococcota bacterium]
MRTHGLSCVSLVLTAGAVVGGCVYPFEPTPAERFAGDVTGLMVGVPPGEIGVRPLAGARVALRRSSVVRTTRADGKFTIRNLPEGDHVLVATWDRNQDGNAELRAQVTVPIKIRAGDARRPWVDLGSVELLPPSTIHGRVAGLADFAPALVTLRDTDEVVFPDPTTGEFTIEGVGAGPWEIVAAAPGMMSAVQQFTVGAGVEMTLGEPLTLTTLVDLGRVSGTVVLPPDQQTSASTLAQGLGENARFRLVNLATPEGDELSTLSGLDFNIEERAGVYVLELDLGEELLPVRIPGVVITPNTIATLGQIVSSYSPGAGCTDLDDDGLCLIIEENHPCLEACREQGTNLTVACVAAGTPWDCDDDGDGQADAEERLGSLTGEPPCRCGPEGTVQGPTCENDPLRSDLDLDGICDLYDRFPRCRYNNAACVPEGGPDAGPRPDASAGEDAGVTTLDAGVDGDAAVTTQDAGGADASAPGSDAGAPDAAVDVDAGSTDAGSLPDFPAPVLVIPTSSSFTPVAVSVSPSGGFHVLGQAFSAVDLGPACQTVVSGQGYAVAHFSATGDCLWLAVQQYDFKADADLQALAMTTTDDGRVAVAGIARGRVDFGGGAQDLGNTESMYLTVYNTAGQLKGFRSILDVRPTPLGLLPIPQGFAVSGTVENANGVELSPTISLARLGAASRLAVFVAAFNHDLSEVLRGDLVEGAESREDRRPLTLAPDGALAMVSDGSAVLSRRWADGTQAATEPNVTRGADEKLFVLKIPPTLTGPSTLASLDLQVRPVVGVDGAQLDVVAAGKDAQGLTMALYSRGMDVELPDSTVIPGVVDGRVLSISLGNTNNLRGVAHQGGGYDYSPSAVDVQAGEVMTAATFPKGMFTADGNGAWSTVYAPVVSTASTSTAAFTFLDGATGAFRAGVMAYPLTSANYDGAYVHAADRFPDGTVLAVGFTYGDVVFGTQLDCNGVPTGGDTVSSTGMFLWKFTPTPDPACIPTTAGPPDGELEVGPLQTPSVTTALEGIDDVDCFTLDISASSESYVVSADGPDGTCATDTVLQLRDVSNGANDILYTVDDTGVDRCATLQAFLAPASYAVCVSGFAGQPVPDVTLAVESSVGAPANDGCRDPGTPVLDLSPGVHALSGSTVAALSDFECFAATCPTPDIQSSQGNDVFYTLDPGPTDISVRINVKRTGYPEPVDTPRVFIVDDGCGGIPLRAAPYDTFLGGATTRIHVPGGSVYHLVVDEASESGEGFHTLTWETYNGPPEIAGADACSLTEPEILTLFNDPVQGGADAATSGNTVLNNDSPPLPCTDFLPGNDVHYAYQLEPGQQIDVVAKFYDRPGALVLTEDCGAQTCQVAYGDYSGGEVTLTDTNATAGRVTRYILLDSTSPGGGDYELRWTITP